MNDQYIYIPTPVSELPEKSGYYLTELGKVYYSLRKRKFTVRNPTHFFVPILKTEYDRQIAEKAWTASWRYENETQIIETRSPGRSPLLV